jgi:hypothetical protein
MNMMLKVNTFLAMNRIQAVAFGSMRAVGVPSELIKRFIDTASENNGLSAARIDMTMSPSPEFVMWLLGKFSNAPFLLIVKRVYVDRCCNRTKSEAV